MPNKHPLEYEYFDDSWEKLEKGWNCLQSLNKHDNEIVGVLGELGVDFMIK